MSILYILKYKMILGACAQRPEAASYTQHGGNYRKKICVKEFSLFVQLCTQNRVYALLIAEKSTLDFLTYAKKVLTTEEVIVGSRRESSSTFANIKMSDTEEESSNSDSWPVNEDWLLNVLKQHHNTSSTIKIIDFSVKQGCHTGVSNLSDILTVSVEYKFDGMNLSSSSSSSTLKLDIIIKLLPHDPFSRYFVTEAQFDLREIKFYTTILPELLKFQDKFIGNENAKMFISVPKCYYTHYTPGFLPDDGENSPEAPESILVLQDMRPLGYRAAHFTRGLKLTEAKSAVRAIANVHALSLAYKIKENLNLNEKYPFLFQTSKATESYQHLVEQGIPQLFRFLERKSGCDKELAALSQLRPHTRSIIENLLQPIEPMGLITHTDFWSNNLLFKKDISDEKDDNCVILDWQMVTYSRPTNDIALLLISSLPSNIRRECSEKLLDLYYRTMKFNLNKFSINIETELEYSREKLSEDYKKSQLLAILLCIGSVDVAIGNEEAEQRLLDVLHDLHITDILNPNLCN